MDKHLQFMLDQVYFSEFLGSKKVYLNTISKYKITQAFTSLDEACSYTSSEELRQPKNFVSCFNPAWKGVTIFIDNYIELINDQQFRGAYNVLVLSESRYIKTIHYKHLLKYHHLFDLILTHDKVVLSAFPDKSAFIPADTVSVDKSSFGINVENKKNILSHIYSSKQQTYGHKLRHEVAEMIEERFPGKCDFFGSGASRYIRYKHNALQSYLYSVVIENAMYDHYYTEKIMDCFVSGTIPIYYGTKSTSTAFDEGGIIYFDGIESLSNILSKLFENPWKIYNERLKSLYANYLIVRKYLSLDDSIVYSLCGHLTRTGKFDELYPIMCSMNQGSKSLKFKDRTGRLFS